MAYNGWTNRNTWLVNVWFGDSFLADFEDGIKVDANYIESFVMDYIEEQIGGFTGFVADLIDFSGINWNELASHYESDDDDSEDDD